VKLLRLIQEGEIEKIGSELGHYRVASRN
jgi:transcriptional regulator with GAF, ATPase, and Fis domain